jgi:hypothetical protein
VEVGRGVVLGGTRVAVRVRVGVKVRMVVLLGVVVRLGVTLGDAGVTVAEGV